MVVLEMPSPSQVCRVNVTGGKEKLGTQSPDPHSSHRSIYHLLDNKSPSSDRGGSTLPPIDQFRMMELFLHKFLQTPIIGFLLFEQNNVYNDLNYSTIFLRVLIDFTNYIDYSCDRLSNF